MALTPVDETHALQIQAGTLGRKAGHQFEDRITTELNDFKYPLNTNLPCGGHVFTGDPARLCYPISHRASVTAAFFEHLQFRQERWRHPKTAGNGLT